MRRRTIDWITFLLVLVSFGWILSTPLRWHGALLGFAQDDFYYYLKPAQNFASGRGVTFDGTTLTNGVQPLYFLLLSAVARFTHDLRVTFQILWVVDMLSVTVIFLCARRLFSRRIQNAYIVNAFAIWLVLFCLRMLVLQMEVTLALPLAFAFLTVGFVPPERYSAKRCAALGLLAALAMLARLDGAILPALFAGGLLLVREYRTVLDAKKITCFLLTSLPLPLAYFLINLHYFHQLLPISGSAKQLRHGWMPSTEVIGSFYSTSVVVLVLTTACLGLAWVMRRYLWAEEKVFFLACFCTPLVFYTLEMFLSDWKFWSWYFYMLRFGLAGCFMIAGVVLTEEKLSFPWRSMRRTVYQGWPAALLYGVSVVVLFRFHYTPNEVMVDIQNAAFRLDGFAQTHPGRYAMGDRAGMFGYISRSPVLQAEGLVMNREYLNHIRAEEDLKNVLSGYGVNYYVAFREFKHEKPGPCFHATEPVIAGKSALRMHADFCDQPVFQFTGIDGTYRVFLLSPPRGT